MQASHGNLILRTDTLLGVCQAIADDFGFNPIYLRIALAVSLLWNPTAVIGGYLALGVVVMLSRLIFPNPRRCPAQADAAVAIPSATSPKDTEAGADLDGVDSLAEAA